MPNRRNLLRGGAAAAAAASLAMAPGSKASEPVAQFVLFDPPYPLSWGLLLLDRSASMLRVKDEVVEGVNTWLATQRSESHFMVAVMAFEYRIDKMVLEMLVDWTPSNRTVDIHPNAYMPSVGETPLRQAMLHAAEELASKVRPQDKGLLVTQTDGYDNRSSREASMDVVRVAIKDYEARGNFYFSYMGAGPDAWSEFGALQPMAGSVLTYASNPNATAGAFATVSATTSDWHNTGSFALPVTANSGATLTGVNTGYTFNVAAGQAIVANGESFNFNWNNTLEETNS